MRQLFISISIQIPHISPVLLKVHLLVLGIISLSKFVFKCQ